MDRELLDVERIDDPLPRSSFGTIGRFVSVRWREENSPLAYAALEVPYSDDDLGWVDPSTLRLFEIDADVQRWEPVPDSGVDTEGRIVFGSVAHDGIYGVVGLPKDPGLLNALDAFASLGAQLAGQREQGRRDLQEVVCRTYLSGDALEFGLGVDIGPLGLPELQLLIPQIPLPSKWVPKGVPGLGKRGRGWLIHALLTENIYDTYFPPPGPRAAIEIVDTRTWTRAGGFPIPNSITPVSLSVSPDGQRLYIVDPKRGELRSFFSDGTARGTAQIVNPFDCALDETGSKAYVATDTSLVVVDTATMTVARTVPVSSLLFSVATMPGGPTVVAVGDQPGPALHVFDANLSHTVVPITDPGGPAGCSISPTDVAVSPSGRAVLWDSNCDRFYEVQLPTRTQDPAATVRFTRSGGGSFNNNDSVHYSSVSGKAFTLNGVGEIAFKDLGRASGSTTGSFTGMPFVPVMSPGGLLLWVTVIHRFSGGGADTLDEYDTRAGTLSHGLYTFSDASMSVRSAVAL